MSSSSRCGIFPPSALVYFWQFNDNDSPIFSYVCTSFRYDIKRYYIIGSPLCSWDSSEIASAFAIGSWTALPIVSRNSRIALDGRSALSRGGKASHRFVSFKTSINLRVILDKNFDGPRIVAENFGDVISRIYDFRFVLERLFKLNRIRGRSWISWRFVTRKIV